jgi:Zn-dependent protease
VERTYGLGRIGRVPVRATAGFLAVVVGLLALAALIWVPDGPLLAGGVLTVVVSLLVHEMGHAIAARHHRFDVERITFTALGGTTQWSGDDVDEVVEIHVAAAGPLLSAALACAAAAVHQSVDLPLTAGRLVAFAAWVNLWQAVGNLVPLPSSDGGRIIAATARSVARRRRRPVR